MPSDPTPAVSRADAPSLAWFRQSPAERLPFVMQMMREMSQQTDPENLVDFYGRRMGEVFVADVRMSLSRRGLEHPQVRVTRSNLFDHSLNPWTQSGRLPIIEGGILTELVYGDKAVVLNDFNVDPADPAAKFLGGLRSLTAIPLFDSGAALNMVLVGRRDPGGFSDEFLPEHVWLSNLFGRATASLVLAGELQRAYGRIENELKVVADIQRSLLPAELPKIPGLDIAAYYQTSLHAGGDYYDFFELPDGHLGILIADVSGHGTPAAVMMAVTHSIAHTHHGEPCPPSRLLNFINKHLCARYTQGGGTFVTAFYGIYNPHTRLLTFANAGHNPPRLKRPHGGPSGIIEGSTNLPLGIDPQERYADSTQQLDPGDTIVLYTDGITEARNPAGDLFGTDRLDAVLRPPLPSARAMIDATVAAVETFTHRIPPTDDRTMLVIQS